MEVTFDLLSMPPASVLEELKPRLPPSDQFSLRCIPNWGIKVVADSLVPLSELATLRVPPTHILVWAKAAEVVKHTNNSIKKLFFMVLSLNEF